MKRTIVGIAGAALLLSGCSAAPVPQEDGALTIEEIAQYSGADREDVLLKCAADEGPLSFYTSQDAILWETYVGGFQDKYSGMKVDATRRTSAATIQAIVEESQARADKVDVISITWTFFEAMKEYLLPITSPEMSAYPAASIHGDHQGIVVDRTPYGVIYNTDRVSASEVPKTPKDLLDPRWKSEIVMSSSVQGTNWVGVMLHLLGDDVVDKLGKQAIRAQDVNSAALATMVAAGEASMAPASPISNTLKLKADGAPVSWSPVTAYWLDDVMGVSAKAKNPCSAMLFVDFVLSAEGQALTTASISARADVKPSADLQLDSLGGSDFNPVRLEDVVAGNSYSVLFKEWADLLETGIVSH